MVSCCDHRQPAVQRYDGRNRLITLDHPAGTDDITHSYFADGALKTLATGTGGTWTYAYNKRRLPTAETLVVNGLVLNVGHTYTATGHRDSLAYPDGTVLAFDPDALGRPTRIGNHATQLAYHPNGSVAGFRYGNGIVHSQALNVRQLPGHRREMHGGTVVMDLDHHYDGNGNLSHRQDSDGGIDESRWMDYDGLDRLTWADAPGVLGSAEYTYDPLDNLRRINFAGFPRAPELHTYSYDVQNRLSHRHMTDGGGNIHVPYGYDDRGNMTLRGGHSHAYDRANRMLEATTPAGTETYRYDGHGRRTIITRAAGSTLQLYSRDGQLLYERSPAGTITRHVHLGGRLIASVPGLPPGAPPDTIFASGFETGEAAFGPIYQHTDTLGSIIKRTGAGGNVIGITVYEPYGSLGTAGPYEQRPGFTGHMTDAASTLTYMQQRFYDSAAMRFLSVDPVPVSPVDGSNFSRYWYANNNPYRYVDPDGRQACGKDTSCRLDQGERGGFIGATSEQVSALRGASYGSLRTGSSSKENKFYMNDAGDVLGKNQSGCTGDDRCGVSRAELPEGATLMGHLHVTVRVPGGKNLSEAQRLWREFPGPLDHSPLGLGMVSAIVMPSGAKYLIEGSLGNPSVRYIGGGDSVFGAYVESNWAPGMSAQSIREHVKSYLD